MSANKERIPHGESITDKVFPWPFVLVGLMFVSLLAAGGRAWATPGQDPQQQTVVTPVLCCPTVEATVGVEDGPRGIAIIATTNRIYVTNHDSNSISIIDGDTNTAVGTIRLDSGSGPSGIAYHPSGLLYVSLTDNDRVAVINASTGAVEGTINVGDEPSGVAVNPVTGRVYVANYDDDTVSVISGSAIVRTINVEDAPSQIAVNSVTNRIFVTNKGHGDNYGYGSSVSVIDGSTDTVIKTIRLVPDLGKPGQGPHGIAVNPYTNKIYVAIIDSRHLVVIDGNNLDAPPIYIAPPLDVPLWMVAVNPGLNRVYAVATDGLSIHKLFTLDGATNTWLPCDLDVGVDPKQGIAFNFGTGRLYVSNRCSDDVTVILTCLALCCPTVEAIVGVEDGPRGIAIIATTNRIYVTNHDSDSISIINGHTNTAVGTIRLDYGSGPSGIAYHPSGLLYVSLTDSDGVAVINASTRAVEETINVGDEPSGVAVNPVTGRVYIANFGSDTVSVISGSAIVRTINVEDAPSQIAVNSVTNRIFVTNKGHGDNYGYGSSVSVIDGSTDTVIKTIRLVPDLSKPGQGPHGIAVNPYTNKIYVAVIDSRHLVVIDGNNLDAPPIYIAPPLNVPIWMVAVNPGLNRVYAVGVDEVWVHKVFTLDGATNTWLPCDLNVGVDPKQGVAFNSETGRLYVSNRGSDNVTVVWTCSASTPTVPPVPAVPVPADGQAAQLCQPLEKTVSPLRGGELDLLNPCRMLVKVPMGAVIEDTPLRLAPWPLTAAPPSDAWLEMRSVAFTLEALSVGGRPRPGFIFARPYTVTIRYNQTDVEIGEDRANHITIAHYDAAAHKWVPLNSQVDPKEKLVSAEFDQPGGLALMLVLSKVEGMNMSEDRPRQQVVSTLTPLSSGTGNTTVAATSVPLPSSQPGQASSPTCFLGIAGALLLALVAGLYVVGRRWRKG